MNYKDMFVESKLAEPLKKAELYDYIKQAREGDLEARDKVITHNIRVVLDRVLKKFEKVPCEKKDLISIGIIGLVKAVDTFDITNNFEFYTYASKCVDNEIIAFMRKSKKYLNDTSLSQPILYYKDGDKLSIEDTLMDENSDFIIDIEKRELMLEIRKQVDMLSGREREIIKLYFGFYDDKQYSQEEIGSIMGLPISSISKIIHQAGYTIGRNLEKQNLIEKKANIKYLFTLKRTTRKKKDKTEKLPKLQTIYEYFNKYSKEQVDEMLDKLIDNDRELVLLR